MRRVVSILAVVLLSGSASPAAAQYFGRNKVQYERFDFRVLKTEHFDLYFYPAEREAAEMASRMAERWYVRLSSVLDHTLSGRQPLILYASQSQFQQTNAIPGELGEGTGGVTESLRRRIVLPTGGTLGDLDHVIGHELVHAFQYDMTGSGSGRGLGAVPGAASLPLWFIEGMAEYLSIGPVAAHTAMWMRGALQDTTGDSLPTFDRLDDPRFFPYRYGHAFLSFIAGHWGDQAIGQLLRAAGRGRDVGAAIGQLFRTTPNELVARWHAETRAAYGPLERGTRPAEVVGRRVIGVEGDDVGYNLAPALSPDGSWLMFFSNRELFSVDLFLADARTGKIERRITKTAVDPHLQSLQFIQSAGSWSPDGRRFAFGGISGGRPVLTLYDVAEGRVDREIRLRQLGEILNPSWSPDGRAVVFSGLSGGLTDLYLYDLEAERLVRLTNDRFADLQPVWSPDGRTIAFATDRFTTNLENLTVGRYGLALLDVAGKRVQRPAGLSNIGAKQLNPQWSPDGGSLYFLSDPGGVTNVYRLELASGRVAQVTDLFTGVSGITETSPALSVAQRSGQLAFSVFRSNGHELYVIDDAAALAGQTVSSLSVPDSAPAAAVLPPRERQRGQLPALLADPNLGRAAAAADTVRPYGAGLGLTYIGRPTLVAGASQFGTFIGGGTALYFSDVLGNRNLMTELQVYGSVQDLYATVAYQNLARRLNWGLVAQQAPYVTGGYAEGFTELGDGRTVFVQQRFLDRQTNRDVFGLLAYPLNTVQRIDLSAGYSNISFDRELRTRAFDAVTGQLVLDDEEDLPAGSALNQGIASAALVYDNSFFGATSPILGQRYRLEVGGTVGSLDFAHVLADYRRYFLPVRPFTLATRLLHYGRYGSGGEDPQLQPLFLGYPGLVRGYTYGSFDASECNTASAAGTCPVFDQLLGSRIAVASAELRFPLLGLLGIGGGYYGAFPIEFLAFAEAGLAWDTENEPRVFGLDGVREPVRSAGVGLRMNLFGFAIGQLDLVRPFDRPEKGWIWQFELQPGF
jgi:hypothetical protein